MSSKGATLEGTSKYKERMKATIPEQHFRKANDWWMSSIGFGTYLGEPDPETDRSYEEAICTGVNLGCNVIDAAINYRFQRSERTIASAIGKLIADGKVGRNEIVLSTKGGFLSFDDEYPANPQAYFQKEYFGPGIIKQEDVVAGCHSMTPAYLENQLDRSLQNLKVDCIDIYFIHNPETQLSEITRQDFLKRILAAFKMLEIRVTEGKIQIYGVATWNGFRETPGSKSYLSLEELIGLARNAGGDDHHFRAIQLPFNLAMPEALTSKNQMLGSSEVSTLEAAGQQNMIVLASASILQGRLSSRLPDVVVDVFPDLKTDAQRSLQFVRSTPGVTSALVGMSQKAHVEENLEVGKTLPRAWETLQPLFSS
jgi:aryl-alcohol dehydrogenase-like predicted oxidoreductase